MISFVKDDEREQFRSVFEKEFDSLLPPSEQSHILYDDEGAMVTVELLHEANMWWLSPEHRGTIKGAMLIRRLMRFIVQKLPKGQSVIVVACNESQKSLCLKAGMREVEGTMFRFDK